MKIKLLSSMIFDAICACSLIYSHENYNRAAQNEVLDILKERTGEIFKEGAPSYSAMCGIVAAYIPFPSTATLDDLYEMFELISEVDIVIREKTKNEFTQSYIFPTLDMLKSGGAEKYCEYITALKEANFEELWHTKIFPVEEEQIKKLEKSFASVDVDSILKTVSDLKGTSCGSVTAYISLLSYPVSFTLDENSFLDTINDGESYYHHGFLSMIAHELMHGFSSKELTDIYLNFMNASRYLRSTHSSLIRDMHSGDEEEFVMAAEYYIMWRAGIMTKENLVMEKYSRYGGCVPLALYIFDHMTRESDAIMDYNKWLLHHFKEGVFSPESVIPTINTLLPQPNNYDSFFVNFFTILHRCSYIIRDAQVNRSEDIKEQIEQLLHEKFVPNDDRTVSFASGSKAVDHCLHRETLKVQNVTIDRIAFCNKKDALLLQFPYCGANVGVPVIPYAGERFRNSYCLNMAYHRNQSNRAEFSFVCGHTRYLITSACPEGVIDLDCEQDKDITYRTFGNEMINAVKLAESIVMLLD